MKKQHFTLIILALALLLAGCAGHASEESLQPIDAAVWPTPVVAQSTPRPTPFPKISLEEVYAAEPSPVAVTVQVGTADVEVEALPATQIVTNHSGGDSATYRAETAASATVDVTAAYTAGLSRITDGQIIVSAVNVRQGPGPDFARLDIFERGQVVDALATNPKMDWVLVQSGDLTGWVSLDYIDLFDEVETLPVLLPDSLLPTEKEPGVRSQESGGVTSNEPVTNDKGQISAVIAVGKTEVRPGPGAEFAPIAELSDPVETLTILGVDLSRQWALVDHELDHSRPGWVAVSEVRLTGGDLAAAPELYTGWTTSNALALRAAPGIYAAEVGRLPINNLLRVIGLNEGRNWARVQPLLGGGEGWTQTRFLALSAPVSEVPLAPAPPPAPAAPPIDAAAAEASAKAGKLALQLSSGGEIVTLNADGTGLQTVTSGIDPQLSPDGLRLAFTRWEGGEAGNGTLWVKDLVSGQETAVLGFIKQPKGADWSPDGARIVINFQHEGRLDEKRVSVDLTKHSVPDVPWNAGDVGVRVENGVPYFRYTLPPDPHWGLRVVTVADGSFEDVDGGTYAFRPAWDPSQAWRLVSDGGRGLLAVDVVNRAAQPHKLTELVGDGGPVFSPDGRYVALESGGGNGIDIYRLNADGSGRVRLTQTPLWVSVTPESEGQQWNNVSPAWSPDGTQLAFLTDRTGRWEVWVMNADGSNPRPMFAGEISDQLEFSYNFVDERMISWR